MMYPKWVYSPREDVTRNNMKEYDATTEISKNDAQMIDVNTVYYTEGKYGELQHFGKKYSDYIFRLKGTVDNAKDIDWEGVNGVWVNEDDNRIFQAGGYTEKRGLFCDLY